MVLSGQQNIAALEHILDNIFGLEPDAHLRVALRDKGIHNISEFMSLDPQDIEQLTYSDVDCEGNIVQKKVIPGQKIFIRAFFDFACHREHKQSPIEDKWTQVTLEEFNEKGPVLIISRHNQVTLALSILHSLDHHPMLRWHTLHLVQRFLHFFT